MSADERGSDLMKVKSVGICEQSAAFFVRFPIVRFATQWKWSTSLTQLPNSVVFCGWWTFPQRGRQGCASALTRSFANYTNFIATKLIDLFSFT